MFIARSVALGEVIDVPIDPPPMPTLDGDAKTAYESAHPHDGLRKYEDSENQGHGGNLMRRPEVRTILAANRSMESRFFHQAHHDAESVFWVMVVFLLRARPVDGNAEEGENRNQEAEAENQALDDLWKSLVEHKIGGRTDSRGNILEATTNWAEALHPKLAYLEPMIQKLAEHVRPEFVHQPSAACVASARSHAADSV